MGNDVVTVRPFQIVIWVSLTHARQPSLSPDAPRFLAILDPGHSHNFSIQEQHLRQWAGHTPQSLRTLGNVRVNRVPVPLLAAHVWIHPNLSGQRDQFSDHLPFCLNLIRGIAVYPPDTPGEPRLPLLGLRALAVNGLHLTIDGKGRRVTLRTARRFWWF
jgi:hypothetical protein